MRENLWYLNKKLHSSSDNSDFVESESISRHEADARIVVKVLLDFFLLTLIYIYLPILDKCNGIKMLFLCSGAFQDLMWTKKDVCMRNLDTYQQKIFSVSH